MNYKNTRDYITRANPIRGNESAKAIKTLPGARRKIKRRAKNLAGPKQTGE